MPAMHYHPPRGLGSAAATMDRITAWDGVQWNSCNVLGHRLSAVGIGTLATNCRTALGAARTAKLRMHRLIL